MRCSPLVGIHKFSLNLLLVQTKILECSRDFLRRSAVWRRETGCAAFSTVCSRRAHRLPGSTGTVLPSRVFADESLCSGNSFARHEHHFQIKRPCEFHQI